MVSKARHRGVVVAGVREVFRHPTVAGLAEAASDVVPTEAVPDIGVGEVGPLPIVRWLRERGGDVERFHQAQVIMLPGVSFDDLVTAVQVLLDQHDALRTRLSEDWSLEVMAPGTVPARDCVRRGEDLAVDARRAVAELDPWSGVMVRFVRFETGQVLVVLHHLVVDGVSWRILLPDLKQAVETGSVAPVGTSLRRWAGLLGDEAQRRRTEIPLWKSVVDGPDPLLSARPLDQERDTTATTGSVLVTLPSSVTEPVLTRLPGLFRGRINDVLLTAFAIAVEHWRPRRGDGVLVEVEGHGRETEAVDAPGVDLSRTVGWFTSMYPVRLRPGAVDWPEVLSGGPALGRAVKRVKEQLRALPDNGIGYGVLRYLVADSGLAELPRPQLGFNYLGRFPAPQEQDWAHVADDAVLPLPHAVAVNAMAYDGPDGPVLTAHWSFASELFDERSVRDLAERWFTVLTGLLVHAGHEAGGGFTPSDLELVPLSQYEIDLLEAAWRTSS